jgi:hypothetical protein
MTRAGNWRRDAMDRWLFIHVMKTAGTSFRAMLEQDLGDRVYPTRDELGEQKNGWYLQAPELLERIAGGGVALEGRQVLCGHYAARLTERLPGDWRVMIFLREPVARALSMISHRHSRSRSRFFDFRGLRIADYLQDDDFLQRQITNYQTKVLAMEPLANVNAPWTVDDAGFERAKVALEAMDFVGVTERFAASVRSFERLSGITFSVRDMHRNKRRYHPTDADRAAVLPLVEYDIELYRLACEKMDRQLAAAA